MQANIKEALDSHIRIDVISNLLGIRERNRFNENAV